MNSTTTITTTTKTSNNIIITYLLWFFLPLTGIHRIYVGKIKSGIFMLILNLLASFLFLTVIGVILALPIWIACGIWWAIDAILILNWGLTTKTETVKRIKVKET